MGTRSGFFFFHFSFPLIDSPLFFASYPVPFFFCKFFSPARRKIGVLLGVVFEGNLCSECARLSCQINLLGGGEGEARGRRRGPGGETCCEKSGFDDSES